MAGANPEDLTRGEKGWVVFFVGLPIVVLIAIGVLICCLASTTQEDLCPQAKALAHARLLDKAEATYDQAGEGCKGRSGVEEDQAMAARRFEAARVHAAIGAPEPKPPAAAPAAAPTPVSPPPPTPPVQKKTKKQREAEKKAAKKAAEKRKKDAEAAATAAAERQKVVGEAVDEYVNGLGLSPFEDSERKALTGLLGELDPPEKNSDLVLERCKLSARMAESGLLDEAGSVFSSIPSNSEQKCVDALHELQSQRASASKSLGHAKRLIAADDLGQARDEYADALLGDVGLVEARNGLEESIEEDSHLDALTEKLKGVPDSLKTALAWLVPLLGFLVLVPILAMLATWFGVRELSAQLPGVRKWAERNGKRRGLSFLHKAAVPRVSIEAFESAEGAALKGSDFSAMLGGAIAKQQGREPAFPFDRVGKDRAPTDDLKQFTDVLDTLTSTTMLGKVIQLLSKLFRRRTIHISGRLGPATAQGVSVVLVLEGNGRGAEANVTLWENAFTPQPGGEGAERWLRLLPAAAAWTRWHLVAAHVYPEQIEEKTWRADAQFQTALAWQVGGDLPRAEALYASTLERDPAMLPAAHNLAVLEIRAERYAQAVDLIELMRNRLMGRGGAAARALWSTLETGSLYTLALALAYPAMNRQPGASRKDLETARDHATTLVEKLVAELTKNPPNSELTGALSPSLVLLASLMVELDRDLRDQAAQRAGTGVKSPQLTESGLVKAAKKRKPWKLIGYVLGTNQGVSRRTHYNLACYYTRLARNSGGAVKAGCLNKAYASLEASLVGGGMVAWAKEDPTLAPLRKADKEKFEKLVAGFEPKSLAGKKADEAKPAAQ